MSFEAFPEYARFTSDTIVEIIEKNILEVRNILKSLNNITISDWENTIRPLELAQNKLELNWSAIGHLNNVKDNEDYREAYAKAEEKIVSLFTDIGQNHNLYESIKSLFENKEHINLDPHKIESLKHSIKNFELSGIHLDKDKKSKLKEITAKISKLSTDFNVNLMEATQAFSVHITDEADLSGLPENYIDIFRQTAEKSSMPGYLIKLEAPLYLAIMLHSKNRDLRAQLYKAWNTRGSDQYPVGKQWDNLPLIKEILQLRHQKSLLLGFSNYTDYSLASKMAETCGQVQEFLRDLAQRVYSTAEAELDEIKTFAQQTDQVDDLLPWDVTYYSERLKETKFQFKEEDLRPYFAAETSLQGMFDVVGKLFNITVTPRENFPSYHPDLRLYQVCVDDKPIGFLYVDIYARTEKRPGAWMDICASRMRREDGQLQLPIAYLTCNATPPTDGAPALLTHQDVVTLFHEFGHTLHHLLTQVEAPGIAGIEGVEWDAVELPSQFLENWCWQPESLNMIAKHYQTGESMPQALIDRAIKAKNFNSALNLLRQIEFSLFDINLHEQAGDADPYELLDRVREQVAVISMPSWHRFLGAFSHIFSGGYAAGYYSYKWAEILSADAFGKFEEEGILNSKTGAEFVNEILARGATRSAMENYIAFRGRKPNIDAYLQHNGIA